MAGNEFVPAFRVARVALVVFTALVVHIAFLERLQLLGVRPDTMLLVAILVGWFEGAEAGAVAGYTAGLATDLLVSTPFGLSGVAFSLAGYLSGFARDRILPVGDRLPVSLVVLCSVVGEGTFIVVGAMVGGIQRVGRLFGAPRFAQVLAVVILLNLVFLRPARWLVGRSLGFRPGERA